MNRRRLRQWAEFLETIPLRKFNINNWASEPTIGLKEPHCNTVACALGWATVRFPELYLNYDSDVKVMQVRLVGEECIDHDACAAFFDISDGSAYALCYPSQYDTTSMKVSPKRVARRICNLLEIRDEAEWQTALVGDKRN